MTEEQIEARMNEAVYITEIENECSLTYRVERAGTVRDFPPPIYEGWKEHQIALRDRYQEVMAHALWLAKGKHDIYLNDEPRSVEDIFYLFME
jgi:hypothetical protein